MKVKMLHSWDLSLPEAVKVQRSLAQKVTVRDEFRAIRTVCGIDVHYSIEGKAKAACVVMSYPGLEHIETVSGRTDACFGYVPGLFSFREIPPLIPALEALKSSPDLFICDGHGLAHPRRFGLACHLGVLIDRPVIGCAKSRLIGSFKDPEDRRGSFEYLYHNEEVIGAVLRTQENKKPVFVSVGHMITLKSAVEIVLECTVNDRVPEPVLRAHRKARKEL